MYRLNAKRNCKKAEYQRIDSCYAPNADFKEKGEVHNKGVDVRHYYRVERQNKTA